MKQSDRYGWTARYQAVRWLVIVALMVTAGQAMAQSGATVDALEGAIAIKSQEAAPYVPRQVIESAVPWAPAPIRIDGDLVEWQAIPPAVVLEGAEHASWFQRAYGGPADLSTTVRLCRDDRYLYLALEIQDDRLPAPGRVQVAFADANSRLITGWRDVGMRYGPDDVHVVFVLGEEGAVGMHWAHAQTRMDRATIQNSFGSELERRAHLEEEGATETAGERIFAATARRTEGERSITVLEVGFPWKMLAPYDPVSFGPLRLNVAVEDRDGQDDALNQGALAWAPGLIGTYSGYHFPVLSFEPAADRTGVAAFAQVPAAHYINQNIVATFSLFNHGQPQRGELALLAGDRQVARADLDLPAGSFRHQLAVHSEKLAAGQSSLVGRLTLPGRDPLLFPVHAPTLDDRVTVQKVAEFEAKIAGLERNVASLETLYAQVQARGLETAYPLAYLTLQKMFIPRCRYDLQRGDADRVRRNTAYLETLYQVSRTYMEGILADPQRQKQVPPRFDPERLAMREGYYHDGEKPVFLWGPCVFWFLRQDQQQVIDLGFNSVVTEVPQEATDPEVQAHMAAWQRAGVSHNASMRVPSLHATGADAARLSLLQEHPDLANVDGNNFLPFVIQHPVARQEIARGFEKSIRFWQHFPGVRSYWLWNEPWYLNYSERTRQDFIAQYLRPRYGTIAALNERWRSGYERFEDIQLIQWPDPTNYAPWYDFQQFRDDLLTDFWAFLDRTAKALDDSKPTHVKFMAVSLHSGNMERYQAPFDINGHDGSNSDRDILFMDYARSLYPDRPLVNTEIHIAYAGRKAVELVAWRLALHGLADGNWWCWHSNQRFSDSLGSAESMAALTLSGLDLQRLFDPHMHALNTKPTTVATLFPDVVERRSDITMVRIRHELGPAQYALGLRPFYAVESRIPAGELKRHPLLLAGESNFVKESTYQGVLDYVRQGGWVILTRGGFAHDEYGDPRDTAELIQLEGGEGYGEYARMYALGDGRVICIDAIESRIEGVVDGGQGLRGSPAEENHQRRWVYQQVLARAMADRALLDPVRVVTAEGAVGNPQALYGVDWRSTAVEGGYTLAVVPYAAQPPFQLRLETQRPIRRVVDLIRQVEIAPDAFTLADGPNLFHITLED